MAASRVQHQAKFLGRLGFFLILLLSSVSFAGQDLLVRKSIPVYAQPNTNSEVILTLETGDRVPISPTEYGKFRKVLIHSGGKSKPGYILKSAAENSRIRDRGGKNEKSSVYHTHYGAGLAPVLSWSRQAGWDLNSDGMVFKVGVLSGISTFFGFFLDLPIDSKIVVRGELNFRKISHTGNVTLPINNKSVPIQRTITFFGGGGTLKYYPDEAGDLWIGAGMEIARANEVSLYYNTGEKIPVDNADLPTFFIIKAAGGYDFHLGSDFYLNPEFRLLAALNTSPMIMGAEIAANLSYGF